MLEAVGTRFERGSLAELERRRGRCARAHGQIEGGGVHAIDLVVSAV
jgi:hypothetical protein